MQRGCVVAAVAVLLMLASGNNALAQESREAAGTCAGTAAPAYQYGRDGAGSSGCASQQQSGAGQEGGCNDGHQYGACDGYASCGFTQQSQEAQPGGAVGAPPPASVQNVVVASANSVSEDAPEASRALDAAEPAAGGSTALVAEGEPVAEPLTSPSAAAESVTPPSVTPSNAASEASPTKKPAGARKAAKVVSDERRASKEVDEESGLDANVPVDRSLLLIPLVC